MTEIINGAPVIWLLSTNHADSTFRGMIGDALVANGAWRYDAAQRTLDVKGTNLVLRAPFGCSFNFKGEQENRMNGFCVDHLGARYQAAASRQGR